MANKKSGLIFGVGSGKMRVEEISINIGKYADF